MKNTLFTVLGIIVLLAIVYFIYNMAKNSALTKTNTVVVEKPAPKCNVDFLCGANQTCVNGVCTNNPIVERVIVPVVYNRGWSGGGGHPHPHPHP